MNHLNELNSYARTFIECRVRQLARSRRIHPNDLDDFRQELYLDLLERIPRYNSKKSKPATFVQRVVERKINNLLRKRYAGKYKINRHAVSLKKVVGIDECGLAITLAECIEENRWQFHPTQKERELAIDVQAMVQLLPPDLKHVAELFLRGFSVTEVARNSKLTRANFYEKVIKRLRHIFSDAGLNIYLSHDTSSI